MAEEGTDDMLDPLEGDVDIVVTPTTTILYGFVRDQAGFGLKDVAVEVNGQTVATDDLGRYMATGVADADGKINVSIARAGYPTKKESTDFAANTPTQLNITLSGANNTVAITGTVREVGTAAPLKGVEILVNGQAPLNGSASKTGDDGKYTAIVSARSPGDNVTVRPKLAGYHFQPPNQQVPAISGQSSTADFTGYRAVEIVGRVTAPGGGMPLAEVTVTATDRDGEEYEVTTTETGTFSVFVPYLSGVVTLDAKPRDDYDPSHPNFLNLRDAERYIWFDPPSNRSNGEIAIIPGQTMDFGTFTGNSVQPRIASVRRVNVVDAYEGEPGGRPTAITPDAATRGFSLVQGEPTDTVVVTWHYETRNPVTLAAGGTGPYSAADDAAAVLTTALGPRFSSFAAPTGGVTTVASAVRGTRTGANPAGTTGRATASEGTTVRHDRITTYIIPETDDDDYRDIHVKIGNVVNDADAAARDAAAAVSSAEALAGVASGASGVTVERDVGGGTGADPVTDEIEASWSGAGSPQLEQRLALEVIVETTRGGTTVSGWEWIVFGTAPAQPVITRATNPDTDSGSDWGQWSSAAFDLNLPANAEADAWRDDDNEALTYSVTLTNLRNVRSFRVDTKVDDGGSWVKGTPVAVPSG